MIGYDEGKEWKMKACIGAALLACSLLCGLFQPRLQGQAMRDRTAYSQAG